MCSLGSRLQSARVSSDPSRKLLEDSGTSPEASPSISSGRGVRRKSSRRRRDFSKAFSKAADGGTEQKAHCWLKIYVSNQPSLIRSSPALCLTIIGVFPRIFDVSGELGEHINACCVGFSVFGRQSGVADIWRHMRVKWMSLHLWDISSVCAFVYRGGVSLSSRNSSILLTSTLTSPLKVTNGGLVPGARSCRSAGFLITAPRIMIRSLLVFIRLSLLIQTVQRL